jgi:hypothetical protein
MIHRSDPCLVKAKHLNEVATVRFLIDIEQRVRTAKSRGANQSRTSVWSDPTPHAALDHRSSCVFAKEPQLLIGNAAKKEAQAQ